MISYLNHPALLQMLASNCCSEAETGRSFHLYMSLCEQYRVPKVKWYCDKDLGLIYMVTGELEAGTSPRQDEAERNKCPSRPTSTNVSTDAVKQEQTSPRNDKKRKMDSPRRELSGVEGSVASSVASTAPHPVCESREFPERLLSEQSVSDSPDLGSGAYEEEAPTIFVSLSYEAKVKIGFLVAVNKLRKKYPGARLSLVPSSHWSLLGNYVINSDVQTVVHHSSHPRGPRAIKAEVTTPTVTSIKSEGQDETQDPSGASSDLQPGCFPEAYIVKAQQQQQPNLEEDSALPRPVCFPEAYIISAKQQQRNQQHQLEKADDNTSVPGPVCYPEAYVQHAQTQHFSTGGNGDTHRPGQLSEAQHRGKTDEEPEVGSVASAEAKSDHSTSSAQFGRDPDWAASQAPTESWD